MKKLLLVIALTLIGFCSYSAEKPVKNPTLASDTVVWAGLDFSKVRMIGPGQFNNPEAIFPGILDAWNNLFLQERLRFVETATRRKVVPDIAGVTKINQAASAAQIINGVRPEDTIEQSHITPQDIAAAVKSYNLESKSGLGAVMIADRFVKIGGKASGAVYVVGFDIGTREVLFSQREVSKPTGFGFRNYWFRIIKNAEPALKKFR